MIHTIEDLKEPKNFENETFGAILEKFGRTFEKLSLNIATKVINGKIKVY